MTVHSLQDFEVSPASPQSAGAGIQLAWPYEQTELPPDADKRFAAIVQRVFGGR